MTFDEKLNEITNLIQHIHKKGWSPGTSTNYSFKDNNEIYVSKSGIDKSKFSKYDFINIDIFGNPISETGIKPSAETLLHTVLYEIEPKIECILHTHSVYATVLSRYYNNIIKINSYEVLKGIGEIHTHDIEIGIPIFNNTQDIKQLSEEFRRYFKENPNIRAYLIKGHGLYTWGESIFIAKRQLEVFEFLLECHYKELMLTK